MHWLLDPFTADFMARALLGGVLVAAICAVVGTWVVVRGMAFLGEAMAHGMLPGVAAATLLGLPVALGAAASAVVMSLGVSLAARQGRLSQDTSIGLLFVGMLGLGVIVISHSSSFATDATAVLFGDVLAVTGADLRMILIALIVTLVLAGAFHRRFVALAFDPRIAATLGMQPRLAQVVLVGMVTLAVVSSYDAVGSLLVVGLLLGPAVAARPWTRRLSSAMALAVVFGAVAVVAGLLASWYGATAAGASIAVAAIALALVSGLARNVLDLLRSGRIRVVAATAISAVTLTSCAAGSGADQGEDPEVGSALGDGHGFVEGAVEVPEPPLSLASVDPSGRVDLLDLVSEDTRPIAAVGPVTELTTDGRFLFLGNERTGTVTVVDTGVWTRDHQDHFHYYRAEPRHVGRVVGTGRALVITGTSRTAVHFPQTGVTQVLDQKHLAGGVLRPTTLEPVERDTAMVVPLGRHLLRAVAGPEGQSDRVEVLAPDGGRTTHPPVPCPGAAGSIQTPVGAVIGCEDGALLATSDGAEVRIEQVPYPRRLLAASGVDPARAFAAREGRPTVAGLAGTDTIWLFDTRERRWDLLRTPRPIVRVTAVDDEDQHVLALTRDGRVLVLSGRTGRTLGLSRRVVQDTPVASGVSLVADQFRAYVNDAGGGQMHEIDFADAGRVARSFRTVGEPVHFAETGR